MQEAFSAVMQTFAPLMKYAACLVKILHNVFIFGLQYVFSALLHSFLHVAY